MGKVMKVFKTLINELFGTKREYKVEGLGITGAIAELGTYGRTTR